MINLKYLFEDEPATFEEGLPDCTTLDFVSGGDYIYGQIKWPAAKFADPRPCAILLHGFPGSARNDDISHALCRIGFVVIVPHHRGAWGSQGKYTVSHCIEDAMNLAEYAHSEEFSKKYNVDLSSIFLLGHSMGANSALNAGRKIDWLRGIIMLTPYDPTRYFGTDKEVLFHNLLQEGKILHSDGIDAIYDDVVKNRLEMSHPLAFDSVKDKNLLVVAGIYDSISPLAEMVLPLWNQLAAHNGKRRSAFGKSGG